MDSPNKRPRLALAPPPAPTEGASHTHESPLLALPTELLFIVWRHLIAACRSTAELTQTFETSNNICRRIAAAVGTEAYWKANAGAVHPRLLWRMMHTDCESVPPPYIDRNAIAKFLTLFEINGNGAALAIWPSNVWAACMTKLRILDISSDVSGDASVVKHCKALRVLSICGYAYGRNNQTPRNMDIAFSNCPHMLEELYLSDLTWENASFSALCAALPTLSKLRRLMLTHVFRGSNIFGSPSDVDRLAVSLAQCASLLFLNVSSNHLPTAESEVVLFKAIQTISTLEALDLAYSTVSCSATEQLVRGFHTGYVWPNLRKLSLPPSYRQSDSLLGALLGGLLFLKNLRILELYDIEIKNHITTVALVVSQLKKLEAVSFQASVINPGEELYEDADYSPTVTLCRALVETCACLQRVNINMSDQPDDDVELLEAELAALPNPRKVAFVLDDPNGVFFEEFPGALIDTYGLLTDEVPPRA